MQQDNSSATRLRNRTVPLRNRMALSAGLRIGQFDLPSCATVPPKSYLVAQPDNSSATRLLNRTTPRYPVTQPDNLTPASPGYATGQSRCATGRHFPRGCASGRLICPVVQSCHSRAIPGYTTGQLKHCPVAQTGQLQRYPVAQPDNQRYPVTQPDNQRYPVTQPDNSGATRLRNGTVPLRNRMALSTGLHSGLPGCTTGQFKYCLVTQPDN